MNLSNEELKKYYFGAYSFSETEDGWLQAFQHTREQMEYFKTASDFWYDRCMASTAKTIELVTEAERIAFDYKLVWIGSPDSFELAVDGLINRICYVKDLDREGRLEFALSPGKKHVMLYLPADATALVRNFEIDMGAARPAKNGKLLWLGDSITQGFGPLRSGMTYVSVANRLLNCEVINQGIGGYVYDKNVLMKMEGYDPDRIVVALGTNQYGTKSMRDVEEYYMRLTALYPDTPILCISPLWRGDSPEGVPTLVSFCEKLRRIAGSCKNVTVVDGFTLVPHLEEYFLDKLHPNCLGAETYGRNLVEAIREKGWMEQ